MLTSQANTHNDKKMSVYICKKSDAAIWSLGQEDPLEKGMATHSSILAWIVPWTEEPGRLQSMGLQQVGHDWATSLSLGYCEKCLSEYLCTSFYLNTFYIFFGYIPKMELLGHVVILC